MSDFETMLAEGFDAGSEGAAPDVSDTVETFEIDTASEDSGEFYSETSDEVTGDGPSSDVWDYTEFGDRLVTVKVDGVELQVPLKDAVAGYMRQADYTRKTQEVAAIQREAEALRQFRESFQNDPAGVLAALRQAAGLEEGDTSNQDFGYETDPRIAQELSTVRAQLAEIQQERLMNEVRAEVQSVQSKYEDFDAEKVLPLAADRGLSVEEAYLLLKSRDLIDSQRKEQEARKRAEAKAKAEADKRAAAGLTAPSRGVRGTDGGAVSFDKFEDLLRDAFTDVA